MYGDVQTVVATGRRQGFTVLAALLTTLEDSSILVLPPAPSDEVPALPGSPLHHSDSGI